MLFLAPYPNERNIKDGYYQRILHIDAHFANQKRVYLQPSKARRLLKTKIDDKCVYYECNFKYYYIFVLYLFLINKCIYIHSVYNGHAFIKAISFFKNKKYILDAHGVVPEEEIMHGKDEYGELLAKTEKLLFEKINYVICVSDAMAKHFKDKYKNVVNNITFFKYLIFPNNLIEDQQNTHFDLSSKEVNIIYSGNLQVWQNIHLTLDVVKNNIYDNYRYTFLTGMPEALNEEISKFGLQKSNSLLVDSVSPQELEKFYKKANYGFILRDDIIVNRVSCPTKLVEYLFYGIIPIVITPKIGDFDDLGFEYICYTDIDNNLKNKKSQKNMDIMKKIISQNSFEPILNALKS